MARIVVFAKPDNTHDDPIVDARKYKRGDVVTVLEDGQEVGREVEKSDWFRVVEVPGAKASEFSYLCGCDPEFHDDLTFANESQFPRKRVQRVDLDAIETGKTLKPDDSITLAKTELTTAATITDKLENPFVFADDSI